MRPRTKIVLVAIGMALAGVAWRVFSPGPPPGPLRYKLSVGDELVYEGQATYPSGDRKTIERTRLTVWVVAQNADGSWRMVMRSQRSSRREAGFFEAARSGQEREGLEAFDLAADGRVKNSSIGVLGAPGSAVFFALPADDREAQAGWTIAEWTGDRLTHRLRPATWRDFGRRIIERRHGGLASEIRQATQRVIATFEVKRGLVREVEFEATPADASAGRMELVSITGHGPEWPRQLAQEVEAFLETRALVREMERDRSLKLADTLKTADELLRETRRGVQLPVVAERLDAEIALVGNSAKWRVEQRAKEDALIGQPYPAWEITDLEGGKRALADYRGRIVVLDFWSRNSSVGIWAMPQMKEVAAHYAGRPVTILGMNTDRDDAVARQAVEVLKPNYPTLKAQGLTAKLKLPNLPRLVIIDQRGMVRELSIGFSETLRADLIKIVDRLLAETP